MGDPKDQGRPHLKEYGLLGQTQVQGAGRVGPWDNAPVIRPRPSTATRQLHYTGET